jgi:hypothetical protein
MKEKRGRKVYERRNISSSVKSKSKNERDNVDRNKENENRKAVKYREI